MDGYFIKKIGNHRGAPRVWLEGLQTARAGFEPGQRYDVLVEGKTVVLQANTDGSRVVSGKRIGERSNPVIDLNSRELLAVFDGMAAVRVAVKEGQIYLLPLASELKKQERFQRLRAKLESGEPLGIGSLSHGGGILTHAIHEGLQTAGVNAELKFANEIRPELLDHAAAHNDAWSETTIPLGAPMQELAFDDRGLAQIPKVEIMELGLPCSGASKSGLAKRGHGIAEAHPEVGHLVVASLIILNKASPAIVIYENVPAYSNTASAAILRNQLRDLGYATQERILNGKEWGALENRDRWCMVAVTHGINFDFEQLMPPASRPRELGDVLDPIPLDDPRWSRMEGLKSKQERDVAAGKGFKMQIYDESAESVGTIGKGYGKVRSTEPKIQHPENPDLLRQLTAAEHARVKGVPPHLVDGLSETIAHEVLGQGVVYEPFKDVGQHVGNAINRFGGRPEVELKERRIAEMVEQLDVSEHVADLASEVVVTLRKAEPSRGRYVGQIVAVDGDVLIQDAGRREGVLHMAKSFEARPTLGESVRVQYDKGKASVQTREKAQLSLGI
ncbi:DNA cytosine methyltransferase [Paraburkholderia fungorum]|uniref:DNA cytosine methyltransferase n=1 Tax=Paraburkholderia fungorum TaxID=134537 RepID=UPI00402B588A